MTIWASATSTGDFWRYGTKAGCAVFVNSGRIGRRLGSNRDPRARFEGLDTHHHQSVQTGFLAFETPFVARGIQYWCRDKLARVASQLRRGTAILWFRLRAYSFFIWSLRYVFRGKMERP
jgi:hypothetical protein